MFTYLLTDIDIINTTRKSSQKAVESTLRGLCIALHTTHTFVFNPQKQLIFIVSEWNVALKRYMCESHMKSKFEEVSTTHRRYLTSLTLDFFFRKLLQHKTTQTSSQMTVCQAASSSQNHFLLPCICVFTLLHQWKKTSSAKKQFFMQTHSVSLKHGESNITL